SRNLPQIQGPNPFNRCTHLTRTGWNKDTRAITLQANPVSAPTRKPSNQLLEEWNHETTQHSDSVSLLRDLGVHTSAVHIIRSDAKVPRKETDGTGKAATRHTQAGEATTADSECRGTTATSDQERPIALQNGKTPAALGGTRPVNPSDQSDP